MIRLAFFVDSPSKRAHANVVARLALGLVESGQVEVTILCYSSDPRPAWLPKEVRVHRLGADRATRSLPALVRYLRSEQPDLLITRQVHANFVGLAAAGLARTPTRWKGKLVLVQDQFVELCHGLNRKDNKWLTKATYRFADGVVAPAPAVLENVLKWSGLDSRVGAVIPNPIPEFTGSLAPPPHRWLQPGEPPVFVGVSNLLPLKRADLFVDAFAELRRNHDARMLVIGEGPERSRVDEQIDRLGLAESAATTGWVEDPLQFAAYSWALVHSSDEDGFAQVLTEAMSMGCPVVTTDSLGGGPRFVTGDGAFGLLVPRNDRMKLAEAMQTMLQPEVRARYAELGLKRSYDMSPTASAIALLNFMSDGLGISA